MSDLRVAASLVRADLRAFIEMAVRTDDREAAVVGARIAVLLNALARTRGWKFSKDACFGAETGFDGGAA